jgi:L-alanine-DL-glutamate epimerase-like enolase superfamily enzyme
MTAIVALQPVVVNISAKTNWSFIAVTTDDGATGWGECSLRSPRLIPHDRCRWMRAWMSGWGSERLRFPTRRAGVRNVA